MQVQIATTDKEILRCYDAFRELRPHLTERAFVEQVVRQTRNHGYTLIYIVDAERVVAAAGYRVAEYLAWGRTFYVDDLITVEGARRKGFGRVLLDRLIEKARELDCAAIHLDSGVQRYDAHRLYMSRRLRISSHHFSRVLE